MSALRERARMRYAVFGMQDISALAAQTHELNMRSAIAQAERARGATGDNPWVGCVIVDEHGVEVAAGCTQGPGEDHAEIVAMSGARARGVDLARVTLYSTLEPCSFHGRTPACSHAVIAAGVPCIVTGIRDPNPRVDGIGLRMLREGGVRVVEGVCAREITHQLASWILREHPHEPQRRARALWDALAGDRLETLRQLADYYGVAPTLVEALVVQLEQSHV
jgi:diaminohydroxyphosphoribosylaminopyrimidine deaminase/5-amino-6-(5-phosphoribosylamino)uracil reductase